MKEPPDPLEAELFAMRPREVSPELRRRIAGRLGVGQAFQPDGQAGKPDLQRRRWWIALAGGLAAACLAAILLWWWGSRRVEPEPIVDRPDPAPPAQMEDAPPTLLAYQRALARSPEELDALLDKQAVAPQESNPELGQVGPLTRSDAKLHALLGDE
jgi:hypothetical protein